MGVHRLRILHISDLHEPVELDWMEPKRKQKIRVQKAQRHRVLGDSLAHVLDEIRASGGVDLVCFTGDIADWGLPEEYVAAKHRIVGLLACLGVGWDRFFVVPGNHDVQQREQKDAWEKLRKLAALNPEGLSKWMAGLSAPYGADADWGQAIRARTAAFWRWVEHDIGRKALVPGSFHPCLGYRETARISRLPFPVHVIGLDSAWLAGDDNDANKLRITKHQVDLLAHDDDGKPLDGFRLALVHHPLDQLADGADTRRLLAGTVHLLMHGHQHDPIAERREEPDRGLAILAAGSLFEGEVGDKWLNSFHLVEAHLDAQGSPLKYEIDFWGYSERSGWHKTGAIYTAARSGHLTWWTPHGERRREAGAFEEEPAVIGNVSASAGGAATSPGASLADYLARLRDAVGRVRLAGSLEEHSLDDVFVELEVSDAVPDKELNESLLGDRDARGEVESAVREETQRRTHAPWKMPTETIAAEDLLTLSSRTLVVGAAGSGKSSLLRRIAWLATERAATNNEGAPLPIWLRRLPSHEELANDLADALARKAFESLNLSSSEAPGFDALRAAVRDGRVLLLIDGLDESGTLEHLHAFEWMNRLAPDAKVVMVSRPLLSDKSFSWCKRLTLHGMPRIAAEQMLARYFPGESFSHLFDFLQGLPDGQHWQETPVLLGLATTVFRADRQLPDSLGELYDRAIKHLLESRELPEAYRGEQLRCGLREVAREMLAPEDGPPRILFDDANWDDVQRELYPKTGLFEKGLFTKKRQYRFSHLTLGERLAAEAPLDLARERTRLRETTARYVEGNALEVLPMAHAIQGARRLEEAFEDARIRDCSDHRLLRLLLRALGYGGEGVRAFVKKRGADVLRLVVERMQPPSGRFAEAERSMLDAAERAFLVLRGQVEKEVIGTAIAPLLQTRGDVAADAALMPWMLGVGEIDLRPAVWWATIYRQARALVRACPDVDEAIRRTKGANDHTRRTAIEILGQLPAHHARLRQFTEDQLESVRDTAVRALGKDECAELWLRERLSDDEADIRGMAVRLLAREGERVDVYFDRFRGAFCGDQADAVRAAVAHVLRADRTLWPAFREELEQMLEIPPRRIATSWIAKRNALLEALVGDEQSAPVLGRYIAGRKQSWVDAEQTLRDLAKLPQWRPQMLARLDASDVSQVEIKAFAGEADAQDSITSLLRHPNTRVVAASVRALRGIRALQDRFQKLLAHDELYVRCAAMEVLSDWDDCWPLVREHLKAKEPHEVCAAIDALRHDRGSVETFMELLDDPRGGIAATAVRALATDIGGRERLRNFYREAKGDRSKDMLRAQALKRIAEEDAGQRTRKLLLETLQDETEDDDVREEAVAALARDPSMHVEVLSFLHDSRSAVVKAVCRALPDAPSVQEKLVSWLHGDLGNLRMATLFYLVDRVKCRERLRELFSSPTTPESIAATIVRPLARDPESRSLLLRGALEGSPRVCAYAVSAIGKRNEFRHRLRELAKDESWLTNRDFHDGALLDVLADDPEAHPILYANLASSDRYMLKTVAPLLAHYAPAYDRLVELLDHPDDEDGSIRRAAMCALGRREDVRPRIIKALETTNRNEREAAALALKEVPDARAHFYALLGDEEKRIRRIAMDVLENGRDPRTKQALRERLADGKEPDEDLRRRLIKALQGDPDAGDVLRERMIQDEDHWVRFLSAQSLSPDTPPLAYPLEAQPPIAEALTCFGLASADAPSSDEIAKLNAFIQAPTRMERDTDPALFERVLAWACVRLTFASCDGSLRQGRVLGEVEAPFERIANPNQTVLIRVSMDAFDLPRERNLRPNHNIIEAWRVAKHLVMRDPPTIVLACANVDFEHLAAPQLKPGQVLWGPTFFGFRIHAPCTCPPGASAIPA